MLEFLVIGEHDLEYFDKGFINRFEGMNLSYRPNDKQFINDMIPIICENINYISQNGL